MPRTRRAPRVLVTVFVAVLVAVFVAAAGSPQAQAASPDPKTLAVPDETLVRSRELVRQLGSQSYLEREQAEQELLKLGRLARPALLEAVNENPDAEVRFRCQTLLPRANNLEMKARLEVFLADTEGRYEHDLPGWNEFRNTVCRPWSVLGFPLGTDRPLDRAARKVFAELISTPTNRRIMLAVGNRDAELPRLLAARRQELYGQKYPRVVVVNGQVQQPTNRRDPTLADIATLLFAESQTYRATAPPTAPINVLISSSGYAAAATTDDETGRVYKSIATAWLDTRQDPTDLYNGINVAANLGLTEPGARLAIRLFQSKGAPPSYRGLAASNLARLGNRSHIPLLESAMNETTVVFTVRKSVPGKPAPEWETHDVQVRDVALAVAVILSGQKIEDYGFVDQYRGSGGGGYTYARHYLPEAERKAAFDKWKRWRETNPLTPDATPDGNRR
jgi:hypothetical protein